MKHSTCGFLHKMTRMLGILLAMCILLTGMQTGAWAEKSGSFRYSSLKYVRPDLEQMKQDIDAVKEALDQQKRYRVVESLLDTVYEDYWNFDTMYTLAELKSYHDTTDVFYAQEYLWCDENYYTVHEMMKDMLCDCAVSSIAEQLEQKYFWEGFCEDYAEPNDPETTEKLDELTREESSLLSQYRELMSMPTIGEDELERDYYNALDDTKTDEEYREVFLSYYEKYAPKAAELYIRLMAVREEMAVLLGYESYEQMQYEATFYREYTPEDADRYLQDIQTYMVPLYQRMLENEAYSDLYYGEMDDESLLDILDELTKQFGGNVRDAFRFMKRSGCYDLEYSVQKGTFSFQTYLNYYDAPFLFINPEGTLFDVLTAAHEFGHYAEAFTNRNAEESTDLAEVYSQAMEYLSLPFLWDCLEEEDADSVVLLKLYDTVEMYVQQASFAEFEARLYRLGSENLTAEIIEQTSLEVAKEFGYYEEDWDDYYAKSWFEIGHFFSYPFYVIAYTVSVDPALQMFAMEIEEEGSGFQQFDKMLERTSATLLSELEDAGLKSPFERGRVRETAEFLAQFV